MFRKTLQIRALALLFLGAGLMTGAAEEPAPDFMHDVMPILSRYGCNSSACHGKAEGQNGFKLSVFGNDPATDFAALTQHARGRRVMLTAPEESLLLSKSTGETPHAGGIRMTPDSPPYQQLLSWIEAGAQLNSGESRDVAALRLEPSREVMKFSANQQLRAIATLKNGEEMDVTWLAEFHPNDSGMADVDEDGMVTTGDVVGQSAVMARFSGQVAVFQALIPRPHDAADTEFPNLPKHNFIDELVDANLRRLNLHPSGLVDDETYLRRVYLDLIGRLPTSDEVRDYLKNASPDKRAKLADTLLERPEYADLAAMRWADVLRVERGALGHRDAFAYYSWIHEAMVENRPLDEFVQQLLTASGPLSDAPAGHFFRISSKSGETSAAAAQAFLGVRITCAECHQHPYDQWTQQDYHGLRAYFEPVKPKPISATQFALHIKSKPTVKHPRTSNPVHAYPLGEVMPEEGAEGDVRDELASWLTAPENPWFAKNLANRIWAQFVGRGLIDPVDDLRATNPASNPELLEALTKHLVDNDFDAKALIRLIVASRTYQLSSTPNAANELDEKNFSRTLFRRLPAEVLLDAVCDISGVPEKFNLMPAGYRAVQVWDSQTRHYFLKLFGRPSRVTACECERVTGATMSQALHLMNAPELQAKLSHEGGRVARLVGEIGANDALVEEFYLACYSRFPTDAELANAVDYLDGQPDRRTAVEDLVWSLLNSVEFVFNH
ncbi:MAG: hypothetical protein ACI8UO_003306 [Verrucomicrobiales bacterium]